MKNQLVDLIFALIFFLISGSNYAAETEVVLIGNFSEVNLTQDFTKAFNNTLKNIKNDFLVILDGDIVSRDITIPANYLEDSLKIKKLINIISEYKNGTILFVPGDRDWLNTNKHGYKNVKKLESLVKSFNTKHIIFDPDDGCPGPKSKNIGDNLTVVSINTQWWNHPANRPEESDAICKYVTDEDVLEELEDIITETKDKNVLVVGHFPIQSLGEYGGRSKFSTHLLPPILGSIYASYRSQNGSNKDIHNKNFEPFRNKLEEMFLEHPSIIYASGHEFNLEITSFGNNYFINSGSLGKKKFIANSPNTLYAENKIGFITIQYKDQGEVNATVNLLQQDEFKVDEGFKLFKPSCTGDDNIPVNQYFVGCDSLKINAKNNITQTDVKAVAGAEYEASKFKELWLGKHYRNSWTDTIEAPLLNLDTTFGGLIPYKRGGGRQTVSLKFKAENGQKYVFRSVNKNPGNSLPYELRKTGIANVVRDQTTTQQPYGAISVPPMLNELDIVHATPTLYVMPDDEKLGEFREEYAGMLGMLEEDPKDSGFYNAQDIDKSYEMFRQLYVSHDNKVDVEEFARARIFDIFTNDWGKHQDNWKWAKYERDEGILYRPIPRDRDHVYSKWDGILPYIASREWAKGNVARFYEKIENVETFVWPARHLDRFLLTSMSYDEWMKLTDEFLQTIDDDIIKKAIRAMPEEIYSVDGREIEDNLISRRKYLRGAIEDYYLFLAKEVDVVGSNQSEYFDVVRKEDGSVDVTVYEMAKNSDKRGDKLLYQRSFNPEETNEIRLYGLDDKDVFNVIGDAKKSIKVRIISGDGKDLISDISNVRSLCKYTYVYDQKEKDIINKSKEVKVIDDADNFVYNYNRESWQMDRYLPLPIISYNADDGLGLGLGVQFTRHKFNKLDYHSKHNIRGKITTNGFYTLSTDHRWHRSLFGLDILAGGTYQNPGNRKFFYGFGNETVKNDLLYDFNYYLVRRESFEIYTGLAKNFLKKSEIDMKLFYDNNAAVSKDNISIFDDIDVLGENNLNIARISNTLDLDFLDNTTFPKYGTRILLSSNLGCIIKPELSENIYQVTSGSISGFTTTRSRVLPITLGLQIGGAISLGENIPFNESPSLGQNNNLKGYRINRFTGNNSLYANSEIRIKLSEIPNGFVPFEFGISGFYDYGRVFVDGEDSDKWHSGYGGGVYLLPYSQSFTLSASVGISEEENFLVLFTIGAFLNN